MEEKLTNKANSIVLNNRNTCQITGVIDVISFDLKTILLETDYGMLTVKGNDLHVNRLSVEKGELSISGTIDSLAYSEISSYSKKGESLMNRLFR